MKDSKIKELIAAAKFAQKFGLCKHRSGNFSVLNEERTEMAITPSAMDRNELTEADIVIMNMNGEIIRNDNNRKPSTEWLMHLAAYETRSDFYSVAHTHSPFATAFAIRGQQVPPVVFEAYFYDCKTSVTELCCLPGTRELADSIRQPLQEAAVVLLRNHGILVGGNNPMEAVEKAEYLEEVAEIYHHCQQLHSDGSIPEIAERDLLTYKKQMVEADNA